MIYVVRPGDTLGTIAAGLDIAPRLLIEQNGLEYPERLVPGQALVAFRPVLTHTVNRGETLAAIAAAYGTDLRQLYRNNPQLSGLPALVPGQIVVVAYEEEPQYSMVVGGYSYSFAEIAPLRKELPYLSALFSFTYGFTENGELIPVEDGEMLRAAALMGTQAMLVLSPMNRAGAFSSELISRLVNDAAARNDLIGALVYEVQARNYVGVDLDFEYVRREDADAYVAFVEQLAARLRPLGRIVSLDLAPKYSAAQRGLLYEGHDYAALGRAADLATLMTYEWGYTYGPPLAVAPIYEVLRVLAYGVSEIPPDKLLLGIANYGYDWTLPYQEGSAARSLSNPQAVDLAWRYGAEIVYDEDAQAPNFSYVTSEGVAHQVWFEDVRSLRAKLEAARNFGLRGVNFWTVNRPFPSGFMLMGREYVPEALP